MMKWRQHFRKAGSSLLLMAALAVFGSAQAGEFAPIPTFGGMEGWPTGISGDGTVVVGSTYLPGDHYPLAYLWTNGQILDLGTPDGWSSGAYAVSSDGSAVVGHITQGGTGTTLAFRWADGRFDSLGTLGGSYSYAYGVSADGSVVVGASNTEGDAAQYAFRWVNGTMYNLGAPEGHLGSYAIGVSADGSVVVGTSYHPIGGASHAFRWVAEGDGIHGEISDLGTLGGTSSHAVAVSADGQVVIGNSTTSGGQNHAFRWADGEMHDLGTFGGNWSNATAVSADGSVVVGCVAMANGDELAFRWFDGELLNLGAFGGAYSWANAVSADGATVVGRAQTETGQDQAFRWDTNLGMQSVVAWLAEQGVSVGDWILSEAIDVSSDGAVIVGRGTSPEGYSRAWLARSGALIDPAQWLSTVSGTRQVFHTGQQLNSLVLHGAHHRPLMSYEHPGRGPGFWVTGDLGSYGDGRNTMAGSVELGLYNDYAAGNMRAGLGLGYSGQRQDLPLSGKADLDGGYVVGEINWRAVTGPDLIVSATAFYGRWAADIKRGYLNGVAVEHAAGDTDVQSAALRLKIDWMDAARIGLVRLEPFLGLTLSHTRVDGYAEKGGSVPASFDTQKHDGQELRLGLAGVLPLAAALRLRLTLEGVHRFDARGPSLSGRDLGGFGIAFDLPGDKVDRTWVRGGGEIAYALDGVSMVGVSLNGSSGGQDPDISGAVTYRRSL